MTFSETFSHCVKQAEENFHRQLVVVSGDREWCQQTLLTALEFCDHPALFQTPLWLGSEPTQPSSDLPFQYLAINKANEWLGTSSSFIVYDLYAGFNPDSLAAISGTLAGGGLMVLLVPPLDEWPSYDDPDYQRMLVYPQTVDSIKGRFVQWVRQQMLASADVTLISQTESALTAHSEKPELVSTKNTVKPQAQQVVIKQETIDQQSLLVSNIAAGFTAQTQQNNVMVVRADRGRGKSAALGMAAAWIAQSQKINILVTAPRPEATAVLFNFAKESWGESESDIRFVAPDELIRSVPSADLLIVDEAAAIPIFMLEQLLAHYPRIVFASTVHGYEGTGRGFDIRFSKVLDRRCSGWQQWLLDHPIRWADGDPLERWINQTFLLDAELSELTAVDTQKNDTKEAGVEQSSVRYVSQDELLANPELLKEIYALLVQAHYRTTPGDLRDLLDGHLDLWVQSISTVQGEFVVGVLLLAQEGGLPSGLGEQIWQGKRRPRGHLLPQYLSAQAGFIEATQMKCLRVVRIAVHPEYQSKGLGSKLLSQLDAIATDAGVDFVGAMFAASADLMNFWRENGYDALRLGVSRDASSGSYTALVAKPVCKAELTEKSAQAFCDDVRRDFHDQLVRQLPTVWRDLEPELLFRMLLQTPATALSDKALSDVASFVFGHRGFDQVSSQLAIFVFQLFQKAGNVDSKAIHVLTQVVLQYHAISAVASSNELKGKKQLHGFMKEVLKPELTALLKSRGLHANLTDN